MTAPVRTCIGCGGTAPQPALVRLRVGAGAQVMIDVTKSGGRGAWLHAAGACLTRADRRRAFARAFRRGDVTWDEQALRRGLTAAGGKD